MKPVIIVKTGDITREKCDAIVNPANSYGLMGGGVALAIRNVGGGVIEKDAVRKSPLPVGRAVATSAGDLPSKFVIHSPTMKSPTERIPLENVGEATYAALECANRLGVDSLAFPGMGTGVGGVKKKEAAEAMIKSIREFMGNKINNNNLKKIILIGFDDELTNEFMTWNQKLNPEAR
ncbi:MAG: macro domain-containing protein [Candidatus Altiarchaeota archaeon]|nr:macro domain-containing protein [Candidatus Altiarchaeota archaeon]